MAREPPAVRPSVDAIYRPLTRRLPHANSDRHRRNITNPLFDISCGRNTHEPGAIAGNLRFNVQSGLDAELSADDRLLFGAAIND